MYERTTLGNTCKHRIQDTCVNKDNSDPNRSCSSNNYYSKCRYSYCPLKDKPYYFGDRCTKCGSIHAIGTEEYGVCSCNL
jgi:hypothetical protein